MSEIAEIGATCRKCVEERLTSVSMHEAYEKIYAQVLNKFFSQDFNALT